MRYLILILFFYSCSNSTDNQLKNSENTNPLDSLIELSNGARIKFHHPSNRVSIVARQIINRNQLDSLATYTGVRAYDTSCFEAGIYNSYGQITLYKDTAMIDKVKDLHFVLQNDCEGLYIKVGKELQRFNLSSIGKSTLLNLRNEHSNFFK